MKRCENAPDVDRRVAASQKLLELGRRAVLGLRLEEGETRHIDVVGIVFGLGDECGTPTERGRDAKPF